MAAVDDGWWRDGDEGAGADAEAAAAERELADAEAGGDDGDGGVGAFGLRLCALARDDADAFVAALGAADSRHAGRCRAAFLDALLADAPRCVAAALRLQPRGAAMDVFDWRLAARSPRVLRAVVASLAATSAPPPFADMVADAVERGDRCGLAAVLAERAAFPLREPLQPLQIVCAAGAAAADEGDVAAAVRTALDAGLAEAAAEGAHAKARYTARVAACLDAERAAGGSVHAASVLAIVRDARRSVHAASLLAAVVAVSMWRALVRREYAPGGRGQRRAAARFRAAAPPPVAAAPSSCVGTGAP
jgi:hypothetical protein